MAYRVLSLDGGGSWALIQVRTLMKLYGAQAKGHQILKDFDLVAANSGGSIVLGGLVEDLGLDVLLSYFEDEQKRRAIFSPTKSWGDRILQDVAGIGPKYSAKAKLTALQNIMRNSGGKTLSTSVAGVGRTAGKDVELLIVAFDYDRNRAAFFRSQKSAGPGLGVGAVADVTLAEAIHASTNAPVNYFDEAAKFPDRPGRYWDGGITGYNNPVLAGVTEALMSGVAASDVVALSIGTANVALPWPTASTDQPPYFSAPSKTGLVNDLHKLATSILDDPPDVATFMAHMMTGGKVAGAIQTASRIVRLNPLISPQQKTKGEWSAPGTMTASQFEFLADLDMDAVEQHEVDAIAAYAELWLNDDAPNQPIRMDGDTLKLEVGYELFSQSHQAWKLLLTL